MKKSIWIYACCLLAGMSACSTQSKEQVTVASHDWEKYDTGIVEFEDKAPASKGSDIYHRIIPDAASYITEQARTVLATLYYSPEDSITPVRKIHYTLEDIDGISAKGGGIEGPDARPKGGNYMVGYRTAGYFFVWLRDNKDPDFLRKFNRSTLEVIPWSFDGAIKHIFGNEYSIDGLWKEYQIAVGDIQA